MSSTVKHQFLGTACGTAYPDLGWERVAIQKQSNGRGQLWASPLGPSGHVGQHPVIIDTIEKEKKKTFIQKINPLLEIEHDRDFDVRVRCEMILFDFRDFGLGLLNFDFTVTFKKL